MRGRHWLKGYSRTQAVVALSSAESELYGAVRATTEAMGLVSMFGDFGLSFKACVMADASATLSVIRRRGIGKLRHINTKYLWAQEKHAQKDVDFAKTIMEVRMSETE